MGRVARGLPPGSAGLGSRAPRGPCPPPGRWQSVSWESVNTPPAAAQRRPQWPGTAAADSAFRRALRLTPPQPGPSVIPLRLEGSRRGGAGRGGESPPAGGSARGLGAGPPGAVVELPALRVQASPGIVNALTAEPGAPRRGRPGPAARSSRPVPLLMQAALGKAPPGHRAHLGCWGHLGSLPTGRSQPQAGQGALGRSTAFSAGFLPLALGLLPAGQGSGCL